MPPEVYHVSDFFRAKSQLSDDFSTKNELSRKQSAEHRGVLETRLRYPSDVHGPRRSIPGTYENHNLFRTFARKKSFRRTSRRKFSASCKQNSTIPQGIKITSHIYG